MHTFIMNLAKMQSEKAENGYYKQKDLFDRKQRLDWNLKSNGNHFRNWENSWERRFD